MPSPYDLAWYGRDDFEKPIIFLRRDGRFVEDGVLVDGSRTVTSATAAFIEADVDTIITGPGIVPGTTIASVESGTSATLSAEATDDGEELVLGIRCRDLTGYAFVRPEVRPYPGHTGDPVYIEVDQTGLAGGRITLSCAGVYVGTVETDAAWDLPVKVPPEMKRDTWFAGTIQKDLGVTVGG